MKKSRLLVAHLFLGQFHGIYFSIIAFLLLAVARLLLEPAAHQAILQIKMDIVILILIQYGNSVSLNVLVY